MKADSHPKTDLLSRAHFFSREPIRSDAGVRSYWTMVLLLEDGGVDPMTRCIRFGISIWGNLLVSRRISRVGISKAFNASLA
jgi:hypothetical protein